MRRLETIRYESIEVSQQILGQDLAAESALPFQAPCHVAADNCTDTESTINSGDPPEAAKECGGFNGPLVVCIKKVKKFRKDSDGSGNDPSNSRASSREEHDTNSEPKSNEPDTDGNPKDKGKLKVSQANKAQSKGRCKKPAAESAMVEKCSADVSSNGEQGMVAAKRPGRKRKRADSSEMAAGLQESGAAKKEPLV